MPKVTIATDETTIEVAPNRALIDICDDHETSILFGCRAGRCGACMIRVLEGADNLSTMEEYERDFLQNMDAEPNERLACQVKVEGDIRIEVSE